MPLDQKAIDDLKRIYKEETGQDLTNEEAWDMGLSLFRLFKALSQWTTPKQEGGSSNKKDSGV